LNAKASLNIQAMVLTPLVSQVDIFPLNEDADSNAAYISLTCPVFQSDRSQFKEVALLNINDIVETVLVFQEDKFPLKEMADRNVPYMVFTRPTFHIDRSLLNEDA